MILAFSFGMAILYTTDHTAHYHDAAKHSITQYTTHTIRILQYISVQYTAVHISGFLVLMSTENVT